MRVNAIVTAEGPAALDRKARLERQSFHAIASQTASGFGWTGAALLVGFLTKMVLTRKMPAAELGIVLAAQAFIGLVLAIAELGIPEAVVRYVGIEATSDTGPRRTVYAAMKIVASSTLVAAGLLLAGLGIWFGSAMTAGALWATVILTLGLPLLALGDVAGAAYIGVGQIGTKLFALDVARPGVVAIALLLSPVVLTRHAPYVAGLYVGGALVTLAGLWAFYWRDRRWQSGGVSTSADLLSFGVPMAGAAVLAGPLVNGVLPTMLSAWTGSTAVAFFGIAIALRGVVALPVAIFEQAVVATWARMAVQAKPDDLGDSYRQYSHMCFAAATSVALLIIASDRAILAFLFGPAYEAASWALRCAIVATLFGALTGPSEGMLRALGLPKAILMARSIAAAAGAAAGVILIPTRGLPGAVVAFALATVAQHASYAAALYHQSGIHPVTWSHSMTTLMAIVGVLAATVLADIHPVSAWVAANTLAILVVIVNADLRLTVRNLLRP